MARSNTLTREQQRALDRLSQANALREFYLAGGTAIGLHLGHRTSVDLDLFSMDAHVLLDDLRLSLVTQLPEFEVVNVSDATIQGRMLGIPVDIVRYPYPPLEPPETRGRAVPLASLLDLATMKLSAIARRGLRRDFWDLHEIIQRSELDLSSISDAFKRRFGRSDADLYHVLRALTHFDDADAETTLPRGMSAARWRTIRAWFEAAAPDELRRRLE